MQNFDLVDQLLETYTTLMPKTVFLMKNKRRHDEVMQAIHEITTCVTKYDSSAKVEVFPDPLTGSSLCLEVTTSLIIVDLLDKFCEALKKASNFEAYSRTDGLIEFNVVFEDAFVPVPTYSNTEVK
ncbi:MAG: hypothetical protein K2G31_05335 [Clostridia bacterium]|nr:hypothetical protein [Clostridia bacterium]